MSMRIDDQVSVRIPSQLGQTGFAAEQAEKRPRLKLYQYSSYQPVDSVTFDDGTKYQPADASKSVDGNPDGHLHLSSDIQDSAARRSRAACAAASAVMPNLA